MENTNRTISRSEQLARVLINSYPEKILPYLPKTKFGTDSYEWSQVSIVKDWVEDLLLEDDYENLEDIARLADDIEFVLADAGYVKADRVMDSDMDYYLLSK